MNRRLNGKTVVITGASGGVGEQMAIECARNGAHVALLARRLDLLEALASRLRDDFHINAIAYPLDVSQFDTIPPLFTKILEDMGEIDVWINNAGFGLFKEVDGVEFNEVKRMFDVNVLGLIACTQPVFTYMKSRKQGHIVNIASQAGKFATPKSSAYSATKHAVLGFTNSLRMEATRHGVFVMAVNPGPIATEFFSIADEKGLYVKNVAAFMLSPDVVAKKVVSKLLTPTREVNLPHWMNAGTFLYKLFPRLVESIGGNAFFKK
jgi:short-subunit dehydrogenase